MRPDLLNAVQEVCSLLETWQGQVINVKETLTRSIGDEWEYDRHDCTHSQIVFVVQHVGWRFSGNALYFYGSMAGCDSGYEISLDAIIAVRWADDGSLALKERFGDAVERVSVFRIVNAPP